MDASTYGLVPLRQASLCMDCETISSAHSHCHACGSRALMNIANTLDRTGHHSFLHADNPVITAASRRHALRPGDFAHST
jgi:hypothetical protein